MDRRINRRQFFRTAALGVVISPFAWMAYDALGRSSSGKVVETPVDALQDVAIVWAEAEIPSKRGFLKINNAEFYQNPPIGLRELYIATSEIIPALAVCCMWDKDTNKAGDSKYKLLGGPGFQKFAEGFVPLADNSGTELRVRGSELAEVKRFGEWVQLQFNLATRGRWLTEPSELTLVGRPLADIRHVLVFSPDMVEYKGNLSPLSYLGIKFQFDPFTSPPPDMI